MKNAKHDSGASLKKGLSSQQKQAANSSPRAKSMPPGVKKETATKGGKKFNIC